MHHRSVCLEISSEHSQKSREKNRRCKHPKRHHRIFSHQPGRRSKGNDRRRPTHDQYIKKRTPKDPLCIPIFFEGHFLGDHLRDCRRDTVGRDQQNDRIDIVRLAVVAVSLQTDDTQKRTAVDQADHLDDHTRCCQNSRLQHKIILFLLSAHAHLRVTADVSC